MRWSFVALGVAFASASFGAACSQGKCGGDLFCASPDGDVDGGATDDGGLAFSDASNGNAFQVQPQPEQDIVVACGAQSPTVQFSATATDGTPIDVTWSVDRGEIGKMVPVGPSPSSTFMPLGATGGLVNVVAQYKGQTVLRQVLVQLTCTQSGSCPSEQIATSVAQLTAGGGVGGVGGEGCGGAVTDTATLNALDNPSSDGSSKALKFIYPYDKTLWPRGMRATNLMWDWSIGDADAIKIELSTTSGSFAWSGTFGRPAVLSQETAPFTGKFIRHPIPQNVWDMATNTAGTLIHGQQDQLMMKLTLASGGQGYGPIRETWNVAPARMAGTVYYQTYGTSYATSSWGMGAATLAIKPGATAPVLVTSNNRCQACHSVSANGATLITDDSPSGDYAYAYDLKATTNGQMPSPPSQYGWGALSPDATLLFSNSGPKWGSPNYGMEGAVQTPSQLFAMPSGSGVLGSAQITAQLGLTSALSAMMPTFSPDGRHVAFDFWQGGPGVDQKSGDFRSLASVDYDKVTKTFSNLRTLYTPQASCTNCQVVWPTYLPASNAIAFELQTVSDGYEVGGDSNPVHYQGGSYTTSLEGTRGELWWLDLKTMTAHRLDGANGAGYIPTGPAEHNDDTTLQYQPTVAPIASGGYAWVVFTSRRLYGNVATLNPWWSDTQRAGAWNTEPMTKKLWMAAIDLNAPPGSDASYPAFYLPAQELMAGNSRAYWVLDPCMGDGNSCETGDQCCGGYCESSGDGGTLTCSSTPPGCGGQGDHCVGGGDCCTGVCVGGPDNGHCDVVPVK